MADSTKVTDVSAVTVSAKVLANIIGVGDRQVRNLADEGILVRNSHGRYLLEKSVKNYIMNLKISKVGETVTSDFEDGELDLKQEQARHEHIKSMISEIKLQLIKGQVHKSYDVANVITDMFTKFRSKILAIPAEIAPSVEGKSKSEIMEVLRDELENALNELADYNPSDYYPDEYIELSEDDLFNDSAEKVSEFRVRVTGCRVAFASCRRGRGAPPAACSADGRSVWRGVGQSWAVHFAGACPPSPAAPV